MYFYLVNIGFEPTPTSTAAPSNTETTVIPTRPLRFMLDLCITRRIRLLGFYIQGIHGPY